MTEKSAMRPPVFRFAPSPNGYLHLGHALSALMNADMAREAGGGLLLRIEDIDAARCRPEYEAAICEDLAWLGVTWRTPVRRQSEHFDAYRAALDRLTDMGLIYPAFESRGEIARMSAAAGENAARDPDGKPLYPGHARTMSEGERRRRIAAGEPYALRLDMEKAVQAAGELDWRETGAGPSGETGIVVAQLRAWGDVILARKDVPTSYHLAVTVDDALQGVTHVVRGEDLFWSTSVHRLLQRLLGLPVPAYHHHRLVLDSDGRKLSKSTRATALRELRAAGVTPAGIRRMLGLTEP
jgi:glutamyl-Q tRNA(Asp) synthetase